MEGQLKRVIVVGAGATLAEALPRHPKRANTPPLDATFFELCRLAQATGRKAVADYMSARFGINPFRQHYGMEEIFNLIYSDAYAEPAIPGCIEAYWALIKMYASVIGTTTNPLAGTSRAGVGALLRHFYMYAADPDLTFVTFNQDLVIEKAIDEAKATRRYAAIPWTLASAYCVTFADEMSITGRSRFWSFVGDESIPVLKLHGSLNWVYNVRSGADPKNALRRPLAGLHCLNSHGIVSDLSYKSSGKMVDLIPLIVPPIYEKLSQYSKVVAPVWSKAAAEISNADSLVFFGYSLPVADVWARTMLRAAIHGNPKLTDVSVVDPSTNSAVRIREIAGVKALHHYMDVASFMRTDRGDI